MGKGTVTREAGFLSLFSFVMIILGGQNLLLSIPIVDSGFGSGQNGPDLYVFPGGLLVSMAAIEVVSGITALLCAVLYLASTKAHPLLVYFCLFMQVVNWIQYVVWCIAAPAYKLDKLQADEVSHPALSGPDYDQLGIIGIITTCAYCAALQLQLLLETIEFHYANNRKDSPLSPKWMCFVMNCILLWGATGIIAFESRLYDRTDEFRCTFGNCQELDPFLFIFPVLTNYPVLPLVAGIAQALLAVWGLFRVFTVSESTSDGGFSAFGPVTFIVFMLTLGLQIIPSTGMSVSHNWFLGWDLSVFVPFILSVAIWDAKLVVAVTQDEHDFL